MVVIGFSDTHTHTHRTECKQTLDGEVALAYDPLANPAGPALRKRTEIKWKLKSLFATRLYLLRWRRRKVALNGAATLNQTSSA